MRHILLYLIPVFIFLHKPVSAQIDRDVVYMANSLRFGFYDGYYLGWIRSEVVSRKLDSMGVKKIVKTLEYPFTSPPDTFLIEKGHVIRYVDTQGNGAYNFLRDKDGRLDQIVDNGSVTSFTYDSAGFMISMSEFTPPDSYREPTEKLFAQYDRNGVITRASQDSSGNYGYPFIYKRFAHGDSLIMIYNPGEEVPEFDYVTRIFNGPQTIFTYSDLNRQFVTNRCYLNGLLLEEDNGPESCGHWHEYDKNGLPSKTVSHGCSNESDILIYKYEYFY